MAARTPASAPARPVSTSRQLNSPLATRAASALVSADASGERAQRETRRMSSVDGSAVGRLSCSAARMSCSVARTARPSAASAASTSALFHDSSAATPHRRPS